MTELDERIDSLREALAAGEGVLDPAELRSAAGVFEHTKERLELSDSHTVAVLAGATGSGKSSLFNRVVGLDVAEVGYLRPTTATALACAWGPAGATKLMDWMGIAKRDQLSRRGVLDGSRDEELEGLVLVDLPDHDSVMTENKDVVDHVSRFADLFIWVLDPQKYADEAIHARYLRPLATHREASVVVLNQVDRLNPKERELAVRDIERILAEEGFAGVPVIATSALTGRGVGELRAQIRDRINSKKSARSRLVADVRQVARELAEIGGTAQVPGLDPAAADGLIDTFVECAGVRQIAAAVEASTARRAAAATDWPVFSWVSKLRRDPLRQLGMGRSARDAVAQAGQIAPSVQRARADQGVRDLVEQSTKSMARPWRLAISQSLLSGGTNDVIDELDAAVGQVDLGLERRPAWWTLVAALQWLTFAVVLGGLGWLVVSALGYLPIDPWPDAPRSFSLPLPAVLLVGGLGFAVVLTVLARWVGAFSARRARDRADKRLTKAIEDTTNKVVIAKLAGELERYERWRTGLGIAGQ